MLSRRNQTKRRRNRLPQAAQCPGPCRCTAAPVASPGAAAPVAEIAPVGLRRPHRLLRLLTPPVRNRKSRSRSSPVRRRRQPRRRFVDLSASLEQVGLVMIQTTSGSAQPVAPTEARNTARSQAQGSGRGRRTTIADGGNPARLKANRFENESGRRVLLWRPFFLVPRLHALPYRFD